jgi:hypothetical protein
MLTCSERVRCGNKNETKSEFQMCVREKLRGANDIHVAEIVNILISFDDS